VRKAIIEIEPYETTKEAQRSVFTHIRSYEVLEVLKIDHVKGLYVDLIEVHLKENVSIQDLHFIGNMEILSVISSEGDKHICLVKGRESKKAKDTFDESELDLIFTAPSMISEDKVIVSLIGTQKDLTRFVDLVRAQIGKIVHLTLKRASYHRKDILSVLTEKQREVVIAAYSSGYYDIPKRISSQKLSQKVNVSRPTLLEHLRKAELRLFAEIISGHYKD